MRFAKLTEGSLFYAPYPLTIDGRHVFTDDAPLHLSMGYKEVVLTDEPETVEGYYNTFDWVETDTQIVQVWRQEETPVEPETSERSETDKALEEMGVVLYE